MFVGFRSPHSDEENDDESDKHDDFFQSKIQFSFLTVSMHEQFSLVTLLWCQLSTLSCCDGVVVCAASTTQHWLAAVTSISVAIFDFKVGSLSSPELYYTLLANRSKYLVHKGDTSVILLNIKSINPWFLVEALISWSCDFRLRENGINFIMWSLRLDSWENLS